MTANNSFTDVCSAVIFCGGRATRLLPTIGKLPKALVKLDKTPYLESLLLFLKAAGITKIRLCISPFSLAIGEHIENGVRFGVDVSYSVDNGLIENAGALWTTLPSIDTPLLLCINGDTIARVNIENLINEHIRSGSLATLVGSTRTDQPHPGAILVGYDGWVYDICEKEQDEEKPFDLSSQMLRLSNCGVYVFDRLRLKQNWPRCYSTGKIEQGLLKHLASNHLLWTYHNQDNFVLDLGTEERLASAQSRMEEISTFFPM